MSSPIAGQWIRSNLSREHDDTTTPNYCRQVHSWVPFPMCLPFRHNWTWARMITPAINARSCREADGVSPLTVNNDLESIRYWATYHVMLQLGVARSSLQCASLLMLLVDSIDRRHYFGLNIALRSNRGGSSGRTTHGTVVWQWSRT